MTADEHLAAALAVDAVDLLVALRASGTATGDAGDAAAQRFLADRLRTLRPDDAVRSEEAADPPGRASAERVWIVDPLDGTREFAEGRDDWAVHVALWSRGRGLTAGAVASPGSSRSTADPRPGPVRGPAAPLRLAVSRSRPPALVAAVAAGLGATTVPMGSAGVKTMAVVAGRADAYVHGGGQWEWDSAAPVAVARAAGLHTSRLDGSPLEYNRDDPWLPDLLVCPPALAAGLLEAVAAARADEEDA